MLFYVNSLYLLKYVVVVVVYKLTSEIKINNNSQFIIFSLGKKKIRSGASIIIVVDYVGNFRECSSRIISSYLNKLDQRQHELTVRELRIRLNGFVSCN